MHAAVFRLALAGLVLASCHPATAPVSDAAWLDSLEHWHAERTENIAGADGWLTLVTRTWLAEGSSRVGSDPAGQVVLPADRAPALVGTLTREGTRLRFVVAEGVPVTVNGQAHKEFAIEDDHDGHPTVWSLGTLTFRVIRRQDRFALRIKDSAHPARAAFPGLTFYPPAKAWRVQAKLVPAPAGKTIRIVNVLNREEDMPSPGSLEFEVEGRSYRLDTVRDDDHEGLFVLFKDRTSGHGTYPPGRFLYTDEPGKDGTVVLDFNRAFSPPCAFTSFATCPLAPRQNDLPLTIEAGERYVGAH